MFHVTKVHDERLPLRFWQKVIEVDVGHETECWVWTACKRLGYGRFRYDGALHSAHVLAWETLTGEAKEARDLDHLCRNRPCVNPLHLEPVSRGTNVARGLKGYGSRTLCRSGRHDITDPANIYTNPGSGRRQCKPCRWTPKESK